MEPKMHLNYIMEPNAKSFSVIGAPVTDKDQIFPQIYVTSHVKKVVE